MTKPKVIVIIGPTASGKTGVSVELAKKINGEIVSADSMQIYREMNIGTAKVTSQEMCGIKHHLIDVANPDEEFSVARYKLLAEEAIKEILSNGKVPIVVGGTGLYISALVNNFRLLPEKDNDDVRKQLEERVQIEGIDNLYNELQQIDPEAANIINKNNKRRVIRALEIYINTGKTKTELDKASISEPEFDYNIYGIMLDREELYNRINERVDIMIEQGLIEEVEYLRSKYLFSKTALQGIGYKEVIEYLDNKISKEDMIEKIKQESRRYAKRQMTWFKRDSKIGWYKRGEIIKEIRRQV